MEGFLKRSEDAGEISFRFEPHEKWRAPSSIKPCREYQHLRNTKQGVIGLSHRSLKDTLEVGRIRQRDGARAA